MMRKRLSLGLLTMLCWWLAQAGMGMAQDRGLIVREPVR